MQAAAGRQRIPDAHPLMTVRRTIGGSGKYGLWWRGIEVEAMAGINSSYALGAGTVLVRGVSNRGGGRCDSRANEAGDRCLMLMGHFFSHKEKQGVLVT